MRQTLKYIVTGLCFAALGYTANYWATPRQKQARANPSSATEMINTAGIESRLTAIEQNIARLNDKFDKRAPRSQSTKLPGKPSNHDTAMEKEIDSNGTEDNDFTVVARELRDIRRYLETLPMTYEQHSQQRVQREIASLEYELIDDPDIHSSDETEEQKSAYESLKSKIYSKDFRKKIMNGEYMNSDEYTKLSPKQVFLLDAHIATVLKKANNNNIDNNQLNN